MTGEQLLHGLWAILPEIILLLLGILVITIDLIKRGKASGRTFGYLTIAGALVALVVVFYQMINQQPQPALAFAGMVRVDLFVQMFRMMFLVALILATLISLDVKGLQDKRRILRPADLQHGGHGLHGGVQQHRDVVRGPGNDEHCAVHAGRLHPRIDRFDRSGHEVFPVRRFHLHDSVVRPEPAVRLHGRQNRLLRN